MPSRQIIECATFNCSFKHFLHQEVPKRRHEDRKLPTVALAEVNPDDFDEILRKLLFDGNSLGADCLPLVMGEINGIIDFEAASRLVLGSIEPDREPDAQLKSHVEDEEEGDGRPDGATPAESGAVWPMTRRENAKMVIMSKSIPLFKR